MKNYEELQNENIELTNKLLEIEAQYNLKINEFNSLRNTLENRERRIDDLDKLYNQKNEECEKLQILIKEQETQIRDLYNSRNNLKDLLNYAVGLL